MFENPEALAEELVVTANSDRELYFRGIEPILKLLATKMVKGQYKPALAEKAFYNFSEMAAKAYAKEFGNGPQQWHSFFPPNVRRIAARLWREEFEREYATGNYDTFVPQKYRKETVAALEKSKARKTHTWTKAGTKSEREKLAKDLFKGRREEYYPNYWKGLKLVAGLLRSGASVNEILKVSQEILGPKDRLLIETRINI